MRKALNQSHGQTQKCRLRRVERPALGVTFTLRLLSLAHSIDTLAGKSFAAALYLSLFEHSHDLRSREIAA
jgi:hypothetical protein